MVRGVCDVGGMWVIIERHIEVYGERGGTQRQLTLLIKSVVQLLSKVKNSVL